jgi:hypothetical protein
MLLVPRGCFKTTLGSVALPIWLLVQLPNIRILIDTHTRGLAQSILQEIKDHFERNERFKNLFGELYKDAQPWNENSITLNTRRVAHKENSIDTSGVDKAINGGHYDFIICDDLVSETTAESIKGIKKVRRHLSLLNPILEVNGCQLVIGTRWAHNDLYGYVMDRDRKRIERHQQPEYEVLRHGAWLSDGQLYFPSRLDERFLAEAKLNSTDKEFSVFYLNEPIEEGSKVFPRTQIKFYHTGVRNFSGYYFDKQPYLEVLT